MALFLTLATLVAAGPLDNTTGALQGVQDCTATPSDCPGAVSAVPGAVLADAGAATGGCDPTLDLTTCGAPCDPTVDPSACPAGELPCGDGADPVTCIPPGLPCSDPTDPTTCDVGSLPCGDGVDPTTCVPAGAPCDPTADDFTPADCVPAPDACPDGSSGPADPACVPDGTLPCSDAATCQDLVTSTVGPLLTPVTDNVTALQDLANSTATALVAQAQAALDSLCSTGFDPEGAAPGCFTATPADHFVADIGLARPLLLVQDQVVHVAVFGGDDYAALSGSGFALVLQVDCGELKPGADAASVPCAGGDDVDSMTLLTPFSAGGDDGTDVPLAAPQLAGLFNGLPATAVHVWVQDSAGHQSNFAQATEFVVGVDAATADIVDGLVWQPVPLVSPTPEHANDGLVTVITPSHATALPALSSVSADSRGFYTFTVEAFDATGAAVNFTNWRAEVLALNGATGLPGDVPSDATYYSVGTYGSNDPVPAALNDGDNSVLVRIASAVLRNPIDGTLPNLVALQFYLPNDPGGLLGTYSEVSNALAGAGSFDVAAATDVATRTPIALALPAVPDPQALAGQVVGEVAGLLGCDPTVDPAPCLPPACADGDVGVTDPACVADPTTGLPPCDPTADDFTPTDCVPAPPTTDPCAEGQVGVTDPACVDDPTAGVGDDCADGELGASPACVADPTGVLPPIPPCDPSDPDFAPTDCVPAPPASSGSGPGSWSLGSDVEQGLSSPLRDVLQSWPVVGPGFSALFFLFR